MGGRQEYGVALAIVLGIVLDGIPESIVLGLGLLDGSGISVALLGAVFLSNLPEAAGATRDSHVPAGRRDGSTASGRWSRSPQAWRHWPATPCSKAPRPTRSRSFSRSPAVRS
jgi:hypothetical protein